MPEDYSAQFEEFKTLARNVLYSDAGFNAIEETLDEVLSILKESLKRKKNDALHDYLKQAEHKVNFYLKQHERRLTHPELFTPLHMALR